MALPALLVAFSACAGQSTPKRGDAAAGEPARPSTTPKPATPPAAQAPAIPPVHEFSGDWFLKGTLTKAAGDGEWLMSGTMQFPTGGFTVGKAIVRQTRSIPDQVSITIPVTPPPRDALVTQAIVEHRIEERVPGTDQAVFRVTVETAERK